MDILKSFKIIKDNELLSSSIVEIITSAMKIVEPWQYEVKEVPYNGTMIKVRVYEHNLKEYCDNNLISMIEYNRGG